MPAGIWCENVCRSFLVQHWHIVNTEHVVFTSNISMTVTNARKKYQLLPWLTKTVICPQNSLSRFIIAPLKAQHIIDSEWIDGWIRILLHVLFS